MTPYQTTSHFFDDLTYRCRLTYVGVFVMFRVVGHIESTVDVFVTDVFERALLPLLPYTLCENVILFVLFRFSMYIGPQKYWYRSVLPY